MAAPKQPGQKTGGTLTVLPVVVSAPAPPTNTRTVVIAGAPQAETAIALADEWLGFEVVDKVTHGAALVALKEAKIVDRDIVAHWKKITQAIDAIKGDAKAALLKEQTPASDVVKHLTKVCLAYDEAENQRAADEAREKEDARIAEEQARRNRLRDEALIHADRLEAMSPKISVREMAFVETWAAMGFDPKRAGLAAKAAEYKDPHDERTIERILRRPPVVDFISKKREAISIRLQAEARAATPISVVTEDVEPEVAHVNGLAKVRSYKCDEDRVDIAALWRAVKAGTVSTDAFRVYMPYLNQEADRLKEKFEETYPMCRLKKKETIRG